MAPKNILSEESLQQCELDLLKAPTSVEKVISTQNGNDILLSIGTI